MTVNTNDGHGRRRTQFRLWNPHEFVEGSAVGAREVSGRPAWHAWPIHDFWRCANPAGYCRGARFQFERQTMEVLNVAFGVRPFPKAVVQQSYPGTNISSYSPLRPLLGREPMDSKRIDTRTLDQRLHEKMIDAVDEEFELELDEHTVKPPQQTIDRFKWA